jgi:hypothetical protein
LINLSPILNLIIKKYPYTSPQAFVILVFDQLGRSNQNQFSQN